LQRLWDDSETSARIWGENHQRTTRLWAAFLWLEARERTLLRTGQMMEKRKPYTYRNRMNDHG
jgi:hypothetical protein